MPTQYEIPTWNQIFDLLLCQARKIQADRFKPDFIVGVARGGLIPARILADLLKTPDITFVTVEYYCGIDQKNKEPILKQCLTAPIPDKKVLLVDDVSDCGRSLQLAKKHLQEQGAKEIKTATIYCKPGTLTVPDYYEKETSRWIVFPWETQETLIKIQQKAACKRELRREVANLIKAGYPKHLAEKLLQENGGGP